MAISKKVAERISSQLKRYQGVLSDARNRDISESDTVVIIMDMLADILGYKKYTEITTEYSVRGTYVDLAVKVGTDVRFLIEAKAIGVALKENHIKQAIDYGVNNGVEWIILSNGVVWQMYKIFFRQPVDKALICELDVLQANPKSHQVVEALGNISREGFTQPSMTAFFQQRQATSKFSVAAMLLSEKMLSTLKREIRRFSPGCRVETDELQLLLQTEVIKRDLLGGDEAKQAIDFLKKAARAADKARAKPAVPGPAASLPVAATAGGISSVAAAVAGAARAVGQQKTIGASGKEA